MGQQQCCESKNNGNCCDKGSGANGELVEATKPTDSTVGFKAGTNERMDLGLNSPDSASGSATPAGGGADSAAEDMQEVTLTYKDGSTYQGQFKGRKRYGQGIWKSHLVQYEGQFVNDRQHGTGRQTWRDGRVYDGQFADGKFDGHARMEWHTPSGQLVYDGQYKNDAKHGSGKLTWPDGRSYDGDWSEGKREGVGIYVNAQGEQKRGVWANDRLEKWDDDSK